MSDFFVRVELHGASRADYELLHARMTAAGLFRAINNGISPFNSVLTTAEYTVMLCDGITAADPRFRQRDRCVGAAQSVGVDGEGQRLGDSIKGRHAA
jgi:hypothetical protein